LGKASRTAIFFPSVGIEIRERHGETYGQRVVVDEFKRGLKHLASFVQGDHRPVAADNVGDLLRGHVDGVASCA
jgi:hypothetical protein